MHILLNKFNILLFFNGNVILNYWRKICSFVLIFERFTHESILHYFLTNAFFTFMRVYNMHWNWIKCLSKKKLSQIRKSLLRHSTCSLSINLRTWLKHLVLAYELKRQERSIPIYRKLISYPANNPEESCRNTVINCIT